MQSLICKNENETREFAKNLASILEKGDIIILTGELGAGKTKFTEGILSYFGLQQEISSPTFTIVNEYHSNKIDIYHFDLYRLEHEGVKTIYDELKEKDQEAINHEEVRILYVAMTRAINNLICLVPESKNKNSWAHLIEEVGVDYE